MMGNPHINVINGAEMQDKSANMDTYSCDHWLGGDFICGVSATGSKRKCATNSFKDTNPSMP